MNIFITLLLTILFFFHGVLGADPTISFIIICIFFIFNYRELIESWKYQAVSIVGSICFIFSLFSSSLIPDVILYLIPIFMIIKKLDDNDNLHRITFTTIFITLTTFKILQPFTYTEKNIDSYLDDVVDSEKLVKKNKDTYYEYYYEENHMKDVIVFYGGGLVEPDAYNYLIYELVDYNFHVVVVKLPMDLAILEYRFNLNKYEDADSLSLMGHSLGGYKATTKDSRIVDNIVLLGAYGTEEIDSNLLIFNATNDKIINRDKYDSFISMNPEATIIDIENGNHSGYGSYGLQKGDGENNYNPYDTKQVKYYKQQQRVAYVTSLFIHGNYIPDESEYYF